MSIEEYAGIYNERFGGTPANLRAIPDTYRTVHETNPGRGGFSYGGYYSSQDLGAFFGNENNNIIRWLFFNNPNAYVFQKITTTIPIRMVLTYMEDLAQPIYCSFIETNYNEDFIRFSSRFYYELFWAEEIYISYDFFKNPDSYKIQPGTKKPEEIDYYEREGGFDTWVKTSGRYNDRDDQFLHVETNMTVRIPN